MNKLKIGLIGLGTVGCGVYKTIQNIDNVEIVKIAVKNINKPRSVEVPREMLTDNPYDVVNDPSIDVVVELIGGVEPAYDYISTAIKNGKHIVTANKELLAKRGEELFILSEEYNRVVLYEAAIAGGIPIIMPIKTILAGNKINRIQAILNGTTNYILTKMDVDGASYEDVLKEAQDKGYAEKDPSNDIDGVDVYYKTKISNSLAFNTPIVDIPYYAGIRTIKMLDIKFIKMNNKVIRHLSISRQIDDKIISIIAPCCMDENDFLANVPSNYNAQKILSHSFDTLGYYGQGAGQLPTAQAMVQNALDTLENKERKIVYSTPKEFDTSLLKETWLIRSDVSLENYYPIQKKEANYYWIENQDMSIIKKVKELDKNSFIALWR